MSTESVSRTDFSGHRNSETHRVHPDAGWSAGYFSNSCGTLPPFFASFRSPPFMQSEPDDECCCCQNRDRSDDLKRTGRGTAPRSHP